MQINVQHFKQVNNTNNTNKLFKFRLYAISTRMDKCIKRTISMIKKTQLYYGFSVEFNIKL